MGRRFWKMSGSGNDFVVFDSRGVEAGDASWERPEAIQALCARGTGVGADGVVFLAEPGRAGAALAHAVLQQRWLAGRISAATPRCASLGSLRELGIGRKASSPWRRTAELVPARVGAAGPEIDLPAVDRERARRAGAAARAWGAPDRIRTGRACAHLVVRCDDVETVPVASGDESSEQSDFRAGGANVNFVSSSRLVAGRSARSSVASRAKRWRAAREPWPLRSCSARWNESGDSTSLITRSGRAAEGSVEPGRRVLEAHVGGRRAHRIYWRARGVVARSRPRRELRGSLRSVASGLKLGGQPR